MTFYEIHKKGQLLQYREAIMKQCGISEKDYYNWACNTCRIPYLAKLKLAEILMISVKELFPDFESSVKILPSVRKRPSINENDNQLSIPNL